MFSGGMNEQINEQKTEYLRNIHSYGGGKRASINKKSILFLGAEITGNNFSILLCV